MRRAVLIAVFAGTTLVGCQTWGPTWSEVTGSRYNVTTLNTTSTVLNLIDGQGVPAQMQPTKIEPGRRRLSLTAVPMSGWPGGTNIVTFELNAEPCKRYYIAARFDNPLSPDFTPFIDHVETIAGCSVTAQSK
jgi:hypothetical protein